MNVIEQLEKEQVERLSAERPIPDFAPGDTVRVHVKVVEGTRERIQAFEGVCIARKNAGVNSAFTVRKISYGEGVERIFPLYSPRIEKIEVVRRGRVRRAKLYYLRGRTGKRARIAERTTGRGAGPDGGKAPLKPEDVATAEDLYAATEGADEIIAEAAPRKGEATEIESAAAAGDGKKQKKKAKADKKAGKADAPAKQAKGKAKDADA